MACLRVFFLITGADRVRKKLSGSHGTAGELGSELKKVDSAGSLAAV